MATILITNGIPQENLTLFKGHVVHYPGFGKAFSKEELEQLLPQADAILTGGKVNKEMIDLAQKAKIISNFGAGYDQVDVTYATEKKIPVTNIPERTAIPTAEIAIGLMLCVAREICTLDQKIRENPTGQFGLTKYTGFSLEGKTLGVIGMGNIGGLVAQFGALMGMKVLYYNRQQLPEDRAHGAVYTQLNELLGSCDVVSIHTPLTRETTNLLSKEKLALLKKEAIVINTARGGVMDYDALITMLQEGKLAGAGLDVFPNEPNVPEALLTMKQVVLAPHIGTNTWEIRNKMAKAACENILTVLDGKRPKNVINPSVYE